MEIAAAQLEQVGCTLFFSHFAQVIQQFQSERLQIGWDC
ncbi:hypothetical protein P305_10365 [Xylella fastidiosa subsp. fastidiosa Mus-1]|jgi:hypothetical protein|nr:hypothetical protein P305_10365 [Xylella fastidiosa subsp. fastidiosa Mus-1]